MSQKLPVSVPVFSRPDITDKILKKPYFECKCVVVITYHCKMYNPNFTVLKFYRSYFSEWLNYYSKSEVHLYFVCICQAYFIWHEWFHVHIYYSRILIIWGEQDCICLKITTNSGYMDNDIENIFFCYLLLGMLKCVFKSNNSTEEYTKKLTKIQHSNAWKTYRKTLQPIFYPT